jgi:hypothetical protein
LAVAVAVTGAAARSSCLHLEKKLLAHSHVHTLSNALVFPAMVSAANAPDGANNVRLSTDRTEAGSDVAMPLDSAVLAEKERHEHVADEKADEDKVDGGMEDQEHQDTTVYPKGLTLTFIIVALCMAVFLVALDQTIIAPALGAITADYQSVKDIVGFPAPL